METHRLKLEFVGGLLGDGIDIGGNAPDLGHVFAKARESVHDRMPCGEVGVDRDDVGEPPCTCWKADEICMTRPNWICFAKKLGAATRNGKMMAACPYPAENQLRIFCRRMIAQ